MFVGKYGRSHPKSGPSIYQNCKNWSILDTRAQQWIPQHVTKHKKQGNGTRWRSSKRIHTYSYNNDAVVIGRCYRQRSGWRRSSQVHSHWGSPPGVEAIFVDDPRQLPTKRFRRGRGDPFCCRYCSIGVWGIKRDQTTTTYFHDAGRNHAGNSGPTNSFYVHPRGGRATSVELKRMKLTITPMMIYVSCKWVCRNEGRLIWQGTNEWTGVQYGAMENCWQRRNPRERTSAIRDISNAAPNWCDQRNEISPFFSSFYEFGGSVLNTIPLR